MSATIGGTLKSYNRMLMIIQATVVTNITLLEGHGFG